MNSICFAAERFSAAASALIFSKSFELMRSVKRVSSSCGQGFLSIFLTRASLRQYDVIITSRNKKVKHPIDTTLVTCYNDGKKGGVNMVSCKVRFTLRLPGELFERLGQLAEQRGVSLNSLVLTALWSFFEQGKEQK